MNTCRICQEQLNHPDYLTPSPAITSLATSLDVPTAVSVCRACGHVQSPDLPNVQAFYDHDYRISLQSDDHDQLYAIEPEGPVFRTTHQAKLLLSLDMPQGSKVMDFGAGKATTLRLLLDHRPDIKPYVFDISDDYRAHWADWVPKGAQATYKIPKAWAEKFDLITAHFVLEHVTDPVAVLTTLRQCLAPGGRLFFTVPDPISNPGDLLVVDHLNHFVPASIARALTLAGLKEELNRQDFFAGAHVVVSSSGNQESNLPPNSQTVLAALDDWKALLSRVEDQVLAAGNGPIAIYGAGFYAALFSTQINVRAICFLDQNPYLQGGTLNGLPVIAPEKCPKETKILLVALNPTRARKIFSETQLWLPDGVRVLYPEVISK